MLLEGSVFILVLGLLVLIG
uniref:Uncharacterized protein n=1 Tax=Anguilla anguilla TaxID=7936 RepID=A0A0E9R4U3_ANGAN